MARILVIDDDQSVRDLISKYLKHVGYDVLTAYNGLEGVKAFRCCPDLIDVVLTDLQMPVMTGCEVVRHILRARPAAKVICMAGFREHLRIEGIPLLRKPFSLVELSHLIADLVPAQDTDRFAALLPSRPPLAQLLANICRIRE
jgi:two-component system cell cycle sensor histidine kinase/response regulator CckA